MDGVRGGKFLEVGDCSGTRAADDARDEIAYVREWSRKNPYTRNRLSRVLTDSSGKPVANVHVELVATAAPDMRPPWDFTFTDETGHFTFQKVPPGEYILGVNIVGGPMSVPSIANSVLPRCAEPGERCNNSDLRIGPIGRLRLYPGRPYSDT